MRRCQQQVVLFGLPVSSSLLHLRLGLLSPTQSGCHNPCYATRWRNRQPKFQAWIGKHSTQMWESPFVLLPMWVSGSQPTSLKPIMKKKNWASGWTFAPFSRFCSKMETKTGKKAMSSQPCQYILIFCLAEKLCLDTLSHCLENNFTPLQSDVQTCPLPHRLRQGNWTLKGDFRQMGDITTKEIIYFKKSPQIEEAKIIIIKRCRINSWKSPVKSECKAELKFLAERLQNTRVL